MEQSQPHIYTFSFHYELVGTESDFNKILEEVIYSFRVVNWFHWDVTLEPAYRCVFRKR